MATWRSLGTLVVILAGAATAQAQTYLLKEASLAGKYLHVKLHLSLTGELKIQQEDKFSPLKQTAVADHDFLERVLEAEDAGPAKKVLRVYKQGTAEITTGSDTSRRTLRDERKLMVAQCYGGLALTYCPKGTLTREELDLTQHFDTLHLPGLLAGKEVAKGATWKLANGTAQALCAFDGLTSHDLTCKLEAVKDNVATVSLAGTAEGIDLGAAVKLKISGSYQFDLAAHRLTSLEWKQHDDRDQGPASPAATADLTITLQREAIEPATDLNDNILPLVPPEHTPPEGLTAIWYRDAKGRYELTLARDWQTVARTEEHLVLRLLDRGDFVAQATLTWWKKAAEGAKHLTPEEFKDAMAESPGWEQEKLIDAKEVKTESKGYWLYRMEAAGQLNGLASVQYFYLLAGPQGEQVVIVFTMTPSQAQKLGTRDLAIVQGIAFPDGPGEQPEVKSAP
jgi:hypothetical protein